MHGAGHGATERQWNGVEGSMSLLVPGGVIFFLKLIQVDGDLVAQRDQFLVALLLKRSQLLVLEADGVVHGGKVVQDEELLEVRHQLHQRLSGTYLKRHDRQRERSVYCPE